jgi:AcrR family transcriptional regulator
MQNGVPYPVAARELLRISLLDAACDQLNTRRWATVTMADIALAAGVSRQTLYKQFGSREEFARALVIRETDRLLSAVESAVSACLDDLESALVGVFDVFVQAPTDNALVRAVVQGEGAEELLALLVAGRDKSLVEVVTEHLAQLVMAGWPRLDKRIAGALSECVVRLAVGYIVLPSRAFSVERAPVAAMLGRYVERLVEDYSAPAESESLGEGIGADLQIDPSTSHLTEARIGPHTRRPVDLALKNAPQLEAFRHSGQKLPEATAIVDNPRAAPATLDGYHPKASANGEV